MYRLGPALEVEVKGVKPIVHPLHARNDAHERLSLKTERALQVARIYEAIEFLLDLIQIIVHCESLRDRESLLLQALELIQVFDLLLFLLLGIPVNLRRCQADTRTRCTLQIAVNTLFFIYLYISTHGARVHV